MKVLMTRMAIVTSVGLATLIAAEAASTQGYAPQHGAYTQSHRAAPVQANPHVGAGSRATAPNDVITGNRVIGRDPDPFIQEEILRHYDSGWPD